MASKERHGRAKEREKRSRSRSPQRHSKLDDRRERTKHSHSSSDHQRPRPESHDGGNNEVGTGALTQVTQMAFGSSDEAGGEASAESGNGNAPANMEPNFGLSGKLTAETNTYRGVVIMYSEPPEAKKPKTRWRLYPFKESESLKTLYIHRQTAYLIGRDRRVVDIPIDHPSCSKQHAVLQYRLVQYEKEDGGTGKRVRPYMIDLNSTNGTYINNQRIEPARYVELKEKDVLKFGFSTREYVLLHENSKDEEQADSGSENVT